MLQAVTPAPWSLHGDAFLLPTLKVSAIKQYDVNPLHGAKHWGLFGAVILVKYPETSVGPYSELIFTSGLHSLGSPVGFHISQIYVNSQASVDGGRATGLCQRSLQSLIGRLRAASNTSKLACPMQISHFSLQASSKVSLAFQLLLL